ncbi:MAG: AAA family ATPase [Carboxylicivirga sp.]|jgi:nitrogenase iron protein|nr:AAA family ATPase [Carboxylicivirga sp.]
MKQIAIYGKGGIGKSTISANVSAAIAAENHKVLQVGCDPKHDSTRQLLDGKTPITVLEYLRKVSPENYALDDVLNTGYNNVDCVEAGGPEPGVGCAGRGILSTFNLLEDLGIREKNYDLILYDVLGDVVCGGFAVPIRNEYADAVYIVTSGEFMSIYSANNILRGVTHFNQSKHRIGGLIFNKRNIEGEEERVKNFSEAVGLPILLTIPRSNLFAQAEKAGKTLLESFPDSEIAIGLKNMASNIANNPTLFEAKPLSESELEKVVLGTTITNEHEVLEQKAISDKPTDARTPLLASKKLNRIVSKNMLYREPLHGCAYCGAVMVCSQVNDAIVISHGPKSCAHMAYNAITSAGRRALNERGTLFPNQVQPKLVSTDKDENIMVFGGIDLLRDKIQQCKQQKPSAIFIVSTCTSGIIGDELSSLKEAGDLPVIPIETDGDIAGDYMQGAMMANVEIAANLVNKSYTAENNMVNIIGEKSFYKNSENNFEAIESLLTKLGIKVNCRYLVDTPLSAIQNMKKAALNIQAFTDYKGRMLQDFLEKELKIPFFDEPFPVGHFETNAFIRKLSNYFKLNPSITSDILDVENAIYFQKINELKTKLKGKKLIIIVYNRNIDWLLELLQHLEMNLLKLCIMNSCQEDGFISRYNDILSVEMNYEMQGKEHEIRQLQPDILLSNYNASEFGDEFFTDTVPYSPANGMFGALELAERWSTIFDKTLHEGWKADEKHFKTYFTEQL